MFHKDKPIDWLLDHLLWVKVCSPEKDPVSLIFQPLIFSTLRKPLADDKLIFFPENRL